MFRQSIDPKGAFPPKSSKKPVKKKGAKKKPKIKRRRRTRDRFGAERKQEQVFKFGEVRSGLSGRQIFRPQQPIPQPPPQRQSNFSPGDYLRIHQQAIKNQLRDQAEKKATGGTFTGTSLEEEKRVKEAQEVDKLLKLEDAKTRRRFVGALESFVEKVGSGGAKPKSGEVIQLPDVGGTFEIEDITERRKPEDDIKFLERSKRTPEPAKTEGRPRPSLTNPSKTSSITTQDKVDERPKQKPPPIPKKQPTLEPVEELFVDDPIAEEEDITPIKGKSVAEKIKSIEEGDIFFTPTAKSPPPEPEPEPEPTQQLSPEEIVKRAKQVQKEAEEDLAQDTPTDDDAPDIDDTTEEEEEDIDAPGKRPEEQIRLEARLEQYKELAKFSETQTGVPKNFDFQKKHYRLVVLDDIEPQELGRQKRQEGFKKGDQFRLQRTDYKGQAIANRGFYFYRDNKGNQQKPTGKNLFKINLANPKVDTKFQQAIKDGKIKIVLDEFEDEI